MSDRHEVDSRRHELLLHGLGRLEDGVVLFALRDGAILYANKGLVELFGCEDHDEFERLTGGDFAVVHGFTASCQADGDCRDVTRRAD